MKYVLGIDIGGTKVAIGLVGEDGVLYHHAKVPTDVKANPEDVINQLFGEIDTLIEQSEVQFEKIHGIGIGAPGPLDSKKGLITCPPNLPKWHDVDIVHHFKDKYKLPVQLENDCNAATLAEKWIGAAQSNDDFMYLTISTGIGSGIYSDGRLISGKSGNAGDVGHMVIDPSYGTCTCGQKGCWELIASGTGIARQGTKLLERPVTAEEVFTLYNQGDRSVQEMIDPIFTIIGVGCTNLINAFDPEKIVIGGGVSSVGDPLFNVVQSYVQKYALSPSGRETEIVSSGLDQNAGTIGAAALLFQTEKEIDKTFFR